MSLRRARKSPPAEAPEDDISDLGTSGASVITNQSSSIPNSVVVKSVWDFEKIEKRGGPDPFSKSWFCGWCGLTLKGWNATKALNHVSKAAGNNDVKICTGPIPKDTLAIFQNYRHLKIGAASMKRQHKDAFADSIAENQQDISVCLESTRSRSSKSTSASRPIDLLDDDAGPRVGGVGAHNTTKLTSAIAEFVYSKGLSFSATDGDHFLRILKLARLVGTSYRPPSRKALANELLDVSYDMRMERYMKDLDVDADVYGLSLFGDGATVHGMPLMNILAAGVSEPSAVLSIVDCKKWHECACLFVFNVFLTVIFGLLFSILSFRFRPSRRRWQERCDLHFRLV
jgi:hypothetical protein